MPDKDVTTCVDDQTTAVTGGEDKVDDAPVAGKPTYQVQMGAGSCTICG